LNFRLQDGWIDREKKGRKAIYSLNRRNPDVMSRFGSVFNLHDLRIRGRVNLYELDEQKFILDWLASIKFGFLNIIQDYMLLGKAGLNESQKTRIRQFTQVHIQDIEDIIACYGEILAERVENATMREEKIWEVRNDLHRQVKKDFP